MVLIMKIKFSPQRNDNVLKLEVNGDVVIINDEVFDLSVIPEGATLPSVAISSEFFTGDISRYNGVLELEILLPHVYNPPQAIAFPEPIEITSGVVIDTASGIYPWCIE